MCISSKRKQPDLENAGVSVRLRVKNLLELIIARPRISEHYVAGSQASTSLPRQLLARGLAGAGCSRDLKKQHMPQNQL